MERNTFSNLLLDRITPSSMHGRRIEWATWSSAKQPRTPGSVGAKNVFIMMEHTTVNGELKILKKCHYPLTARGVVKKIFTDLAIIDVTPKGLELRELAPGLSVKDIQSVTDLN
jgi:hypothetical protein